MRYLLPLFLLLPLSATAALTPEATRVVFHGVKSGTSINIINDGVSPYLAQTWLEDGQGNKITEPLTTLPPLQRIDQNQSRSVRISKVGDVSKLPVDREALFFFHLLEIPPKPKEENVLQFTMQSVIKVFYRPAGLRYQGSAEWQKDLAVSIRGKKVIFANPSPYYVVLANVVGENKVSYVKDDFNENIEPFGEFTLELKTAPKNYLEVGYIDDYGGYNTMTYRCNAGTCQRQETAEKQ